MRVRNSGRRLRESGSRGEGAGFLARRSVFRAYTYAAVRYCILTTYTTIYDHLRKERGRFRGDLRRFKIRPQNAISLCLKMRLGYLARHACRRVANTFYSLPDV